MLPAAHAQPASIDIPGAPIPIRILVRSPAETATELQVICLFRSSPVNTLHGSLMEANEKLGGVGCYAHHRSRRFADFCAELR